MVVERLNIFVDETGDFGFGKDASELYGVSFTFHEHQNEITDELNKFNNKLLNIGYTKMIHMADLVMKRGDYKTFNISTRKSIFNAIYQFSRRVNVKYSSIIIDKKYNNKKEQLRRALAHDINKMVKEKEEYFNRFDSIVLYYDNGQETLSIILDSIFSAFDGYMHKSNFDHEEKRLFQVSDMLTYIDKYDYKYKNKMNFTRSEQYFFTIEEIRKVLKEINKKRFR